MIEFISMTKAEEETGFSKTYLTKLHKQYPDAKIIRRTPTGGPVFSIRAYNNLMLSGSTKQTPAAGRSPAPLV